jgi:hypothetical protein
MKLWLPPLLGLLSLTLSSCIIGSFAPTTRNIPFNEKDFAGYDRPGTGSLHGQVTADWEGYHYISQRELVRLVPVTPYTDEMVTRELGHGVRLTQADLRFKKYARYTKTDDSGHYAFSGVPAGRYYLVGYTTWDTGNPDNPVDYLWSCERVTLGKGQSLKIDATHNPHVEHGVYQGSWSGD